MKKFIIKISLTLFFAIILIAFSSSCKKKYDYHIKGTVVKATTQEPLEGVVVEVYNEICHGLPFTGGGCGPDPDDFHYTTTNVNGEFEMVIISEESALELNFKKKFMYRFFNDTDNLLYPGTTTLNLGMTAETEEFTIVFEPTLPNVQEVTLGLEWNRFPRGNQENIILGSLSSLFTIESSAYLSQYSPPLQYSIRDGEQWLKMNFDILLEDGSQLQKTDSIWLPGRYYDINDYDFGDPRKYPVYKFRY